MDGGYDDDDDDDDDDDNDDNDDEGRPICPACQTILLLSMAWPFVASERRRSPVCPLPRSFAQNLSAHQTNPC